MRLLYPDEGATTRDFIVMHYPYQLSPAEGFGSYPPRLPAALRDGGSASLGAPRTLGYSILTWFRVYSVAARMLELRTISTRRLPGQAEKQPEFVVESLQVKKHLGRELKSYRLLQKSVLLSKLFVVDVGPLSLFVATVAPRSFRVEVSRCLHICP